MKKSYILVFITVISLSVNAQLVYKDVAGIFNNRCTGCHHPDGGAPFSMMTYSQILPWGNQIKNNLQTGKMPPWSPDTSYKHFIYERTITQTEKNTIYNWIANGMQKGDTTLAPPAPTYTKYKLSGKPDLILKIPTFTSNAITKDAYDCMVLPTGLTQDRIIRAFEVVPGNSAIVHHVGVNIDSSGAATDDLSGTCYSAPGDATLDVYAPGSPPTVYSGQAPLKMGVRIKAGSSIVLNIHYPQGSAGQKDSTQIRLYFYPVNATGVRPVYLAGLLTNSNLYIPANTIKTYTDQYPPIGTLPVPISFYSAFPHSHLIATTIENYAFSPTDTIPLLRINKWNFEWQGFYTFNKMVKVPAGYKLFAKHTYDNTAGNPNNPNHPPQLITVGYNTTDEMFVDFFQYMIYQPGDENLDIGALLANDTLLHPVAVSVSEHSSFAISSFASPNPFGEYVKIGYELTHPADVAISIFNLYGDEIKNLSYQRNNSAGTYSVIWDGKNDDGAKVPAGIYFYTIRSGQKKAGGKIVLMQK